MKKAETGLALLMLAVAVWLHFVRFQTAGGLWRDEVSAVNLALTPNVADIPQLLEHEAFPVLFPLALRAYVTLAGSSDGALRTFGFIMGVGVLCVLWVSAVTLTSRPPLLSLGLAGMSSSVVQWVDWTRGHGLGTVLMLLAFVLLWRVAVAPGRRWIVLAALVSIAAVHTLYYNAVLLFAAGCAAAVVAVRNGSWQRALLVLGIGAVAAVSMLPYLGVMQRAADSSVIFELPRFTLGLFWSNLSSALAAGPGVQWMWAMLALGAVVIAGWRGSVAVGGAIALVLSVAGYFLFLKLLKYPSQPWYYVPLLAFAAVAIDAAWNSLHNRWSSVARMVVALLIAGIAVGPVRSAIQVRQTNVDLIAAKLQEQVSSDDLIVVMPWYLGVTFSRYYNGPASWITVPPVGDHQLQRYDLLKGQMAAREPLAPVFAAMERALSGGHRVWLVGEPLFPEMGTQPPVLEPAPDPGAGWSEGAYMTSWLLQTMHFLQHRVWRAEEVKIDAGRPVNPHENARLFMVSGWR